MTQLTLESSERGTFVKPKRKGGDHKRKARPIAPATFTVRDGEIVVVVPDVLGKNASHQSGRFLSPQTKALRASVRAGVNLWRTAEVTRANLVGGNARIEWSQAMDGAWRIEVVGVWPDQRHTIKGRPVDFRPCPEGDADATPPQVLDALQHAGILDDDARVVEVRAWNMYRKSERWTVIRLVRVPDLAERDAAIAHLVAMLPPPSEAAQAPATAKRKRGRKAQDAC